MDPDELLQLEKSPKRKPLKLAILSTFYITAVSCPYPTPSKPLSAPAMPPNVGDEPQPPPNQTTTTMTTTTTTTTTSSSSSTSAYSPFTRQLRQMGLFFAGATFLAASVAVSRRSVLRRRLESLPAFHTSNRHATAFDGTDRIGLATQALGLATLNVMSFGVLLTGGIGWGFDLCSVAELRQRTQAALQRPGSMDPEAEKEMEEMMKSLLERLGMDATPPARPPMPGASADAPPK